MDLINGVIVKELKVIPDDRGRLMEILRKDDNLFTEFGQVYMTTAYPGIVKAWHSHNLQADNLTCIVGKIRVGLYDPRDNSSTYKKTNEFILSLEEPKIIHIPKFVYHGFKNIGDNEAIVINTITKPYNRNNPDEYRVDAYDNDIDYDWKK